MIAKIATAMPAPARNNQKLNGRDTKDQHSYIQKSLL
jgi:hypothetical protein